MTRTQKVKRTEILNCIKALEGRKDCQTARNLLLQKLRKFELKLEKLN
jgi:hypothetical protein